MASRAARWACSACLDPAPYLARASVALSWALAASPMALAWGITAAVNATVATPAAAAPAAIGASWAAMGTRAGVSPIRAPFSLSRPSVRDASARRRRSAASASELLPVIAIRTSFPICCLPSPVVVRLQAHVLVRRPGQLDYLDHAEQVHVLLQKLTGQAVEPVAQAQDHLRPDQLSRLW